ncbi:MAG: hypothetical protein HC802_04615, partial [Caldilineaceae bacterium]|nr:hypothetical protein [Caldilineaceae bacterium]
MDRHGRPAGLALHHPVSSFPRRRASRADADRTRAGDPTHLHVNAASDRDSACNVHADSGRSDAIRCHPIALLHTDLGIGFGRIGASAAPAATATPTQTPTPTPTEGFGGPYYGVHYVPMEDLATVKALGADVVLRDMPDHGTPEEWLAILDEFEANDLQLLAWFWEQGWTFDRATDEWTISDQARLFLETVAGHPALFAVY